MRWFAAVLGLCIAQLSALHCLQSEREAAECCEPHQLCCLSYYFLLSAEGLPSKLLATMLLLACELPDLYQGATYAKTGFCRRYWSTHTLLACKHMLAGCILQLHGGCTCSCSSALFIVCDSRMHLMTSTMQVYAIKNNNRSAPAVHEQQGCQSVIATHAEQIRLRLCCCNTSQSRL